MSVDYLPQAVKNENAKAQKLGCYDFPEAKTCTEELQKKIFSNLSLMDQWSIWIANNKTLSPEEFCDPNSETDAFGKLVKDVAPLIKILGKKEALEVDLKKKDEKCDEVSKVDAKDSKQLGYFKNLLNKKVEETKLSDYLELWYPSPENDNDPYFFSCQSKPWGNLDKALQLNSLKYLPQECKPDVLYSWGPPIKLESMKKAMEDGKHWKDQPNPIPGKKDTALFMALTPLSSFGYGEVMVRVKIKPETPFITKNSHYFEDNGETPGVRVRINDDYQDFTMKEASFIESWSYGTPQIYDELVRDTKRALAGKRAQTYMTPWKPANALSDHMQSPDGLETNEEILKGRFRKLIEMITKGEGKVHFQKDSCRNKNLHYQTTRPTYFNPQ